MFKGVYGPGQRKSSESPSVFSPDGTCKTLHEEAFGCPPPASAAAFEAPNRALWSFHAALIVNCAGQEQQRVHSQVGSWRLNGGAGRS